MKKADQVGTWDTRHNKAVREEASCLETPRGKNLFKSPLRHPFFLARGPGKRQQAWQDRSISIITFLFWPVDAEKKLWPNLHPFQLAPYGELKCLHVQDCYEPPQPPSDSFHPGWCQRRSHGESGLSLLLSINESNTCGVSEGHMGSSILASLTLPARVVSVEASRKARTPTSPRTNKEFLSLSMSKEIR